MTGNCGYVLGYPKNRTHLDILRQYLVNVNEKGLLLKDNQECILECEKKIRMRYLRLFQAIAKLT